MAINGPAAGLITVILGGLVAQCMPERDQSEIFKNNHEVYGSLCLGVVMHSLAGKLAASKLGARAMTANCIVDNLSEAFTEVNNYSLS